MPAVRDSVRRDGRGGGVASGLKPGERPAHRSLREAMSNITLFIPLLFVLLAGCSHDESATRVAVESEIDHSTPHVLTGPSGGTPEQVRTSMDPGVDVDEKEGEDGRTPLHLADRSNGEPPPATRSYPVHSHNDYLRHRPLHEALAAGCSSIEVDVHAVDGDLFVAHDRDQVVSGRTLGSMYLEPLAAQLEDSPRIYADDPAPLILMIDVKSSWTEAAPILREQLAPLARYLLPPAGTHSGDGGVMVVTSGAGSGRQGLDAGVAAVDGRPNDLGTGVDPVHMPVVSTSYAGMFRKWSTGSLDESDRRRMRSLGEAARAEGKLLRFWAAPDTPAAWDFLIEHGCGLISTDRPTTCCAHLAAEYKDSTRRR